MQWLEELTLNKALRYFVIGGAFFLPFVPIIIATSMFFPFITGKNFTFRVVVELIAVAWMILAIREAYFRPKFSWIYAALAVFLSVITIADVFGANFFRSFWSNYERMEGLVTHFHLFAYFVVAISVLKKEELWERFFHISMGVSLFIALYGMLQLSHELVINQGGVRVDGTFGNATYLAVYMLFHMFFTAYFFLRGKLLNAGNLFVPGFVGFGLYALFTLMRFGNAGIQTGPVEKGIFILSLFALGTFGFLYIRELGGVWIRRALYGSLFALQFYLLFRTETRGAMIGLVGGVFVASALYVLFGRSSKKARQIGAGVFLLMLILVGTLWALRSTEFVQNSSALNRFTNISLESGRARFLIWGMSLEGFKERPILGWGQENFNLVFNKYYDPRMYDQEPWFDRSHNIFFDWLMAGGILGLLAYLSIYASLLYYLWFYRKRDGESPWTLVERVVLTGLTTAYFLQNVFVFDNIVSYLMFFSILAYAHTRSVEDGEGYPPRENSSRRSEPADMAIIAFVLIAFCFVFYTVNYKGISMNRALLQGLASHSEGVTKNLEYFKKALDINSFGIIETREQLVMLAVQAAGANIPNDKKQEIFTLAKNEMTKQVDASPKDARYRLFLANLYMNYRLFDDAIVQLEKGIEASPRKQTTYFALANAYAQKTDYRQALEAAKKAYEFEPKNTEALRIYAAAAIYASQDKLAKELLEPVYGSIYVDDPLIINALVARKQFNAVANIWKARIEKNPNDTQAHLSLAAAYLELGQRESAIKEIQEVIKLNPEFKEQGEHYINEIRAGRNP